MEKKPTLYICDPLKNTDCKKTGCVYNQDAPMKNCARTKNPAFAVLDENGEPIRAGKILSVEDFVQLVLAGISEDEAIRQGAELPDDLGLTAEEEKEAIERFLNRVRQKCEQMGKATDWTALFRGIE